MLRPRSLLDVLAQPIKQERDKIRPDNGAHGILISSMVITKNGSSVSSYHSSKPTPQARADDYPSNIGSDASSEVEGSAYSVDRAMKTKVYSIYSAAAWRDYVGHDVSTVNEVDGTSGWISVKTSDALIFIQEIDARLLYVLIANVDAPLGYLQMKSDNMVELLRDELKDFRLQE